MADHCPYSDLPVGTCACDRCQTRTTDLLIGELDAMEAVDRELEEADRE